MKSWFCEETAAVVESIDPTDAKGGPRMNKKRFLRQGIFKFS